MKVRVDMPEAILTNVDNWRWKGTGHYMSGHMYRGTEMEAFETIDSCDNCDGARCDHCEERKIPAHWELSVSTDELCEALKAAGIDNDVAEDLAYNDFGSSTHYLSWDYEPSKEVLEKLHELHGVAQ